MQDKRALPAVPSPDEQTSLAEHASGSRDGADHASGSTLAGRPSARARAPRVEPVVEPTPAPAARSISAASSHITHGSAQSEASVAHALLGDEIARSHGFSGLIAVIATAVLVALPMLDGDPRAKLACAIALTLIVPASIGVWRMTRHEQRQTRQVLRVYSFTLASLVLVVEYFVGLFSPVPAVVTLGIYHFAQSADVVQALGTPAFVIASYALLASLVTLQVLPDVGLLNASSSSMSSHVFAIVAISLLFVLTTRMGRGARASMRAAIARSTEAMLVAREREVLLAEAQQHLERALVVAIGKAGHYTGQLAGSYKLDVIVGLGAMGEVYAATHVLTGKPAAVKLMRPTSLQRADLVERFLREGAICSELKHPQLVQVYGAGTLEDSAPYLAMELLRGQDLAAQLRKTGPMPLHEALQLSAALAEGLAYVHDNGVVHRDLKPVNVFHAEDDQGRKQWKILDFGISKPRASSGTLTDVAVVGTPGYMSPEQARGRAVDQRSDIFSMAVVLYRALTGRPAFSGNDTPQIMFEVVYHMPERPSSVVKQLPSDVDLVFAIALAKSPEERFASVRDFAEALQRAAARQLEGPLRTRAQTILRACPWGQPIVAIAGRVSAPASEPPAGSRPEVQGTTL